jgi:hypothetical protein
MLREAVLLAGLCLARRVVSSSEPLLKVAAPGLVPHGASQIVDHAFASFSFPAHWLADFAGRLLPGQLTICHEAKSRRKQQLP